ncbi:armadillo-type protein [Gaertneriomyces semiglobifer]|nr:armadillo-type protein [Gaertneriomyces semiglobifer]
MSQDPFSFTTSTDAAGAHGRSRSSARRLHFTQKIVPPSTGRPIPVGELINRLKKLHNDLSRLDQDDVDTKSLMTVQKDLRSPSLIAHKDKGVRALTACCLADILRLFAPDAPYNENQLREIFEFFAKQLQYITDRNGPYFSFYFYLLDSLSTVKSVVLVADLNAEDLISEFFRSFFDLIKPDFPKNIYMCMVDILQQLVDESPQLPQDVVDIILSHFNKRRQTENPAAFKMAADLCNACPDHLQRYVSNYFGDAIIAAGRGFEDENEEKDFEDAHKLILEVHRAAPAVLLNVVPQLDEELKLDDAHVRAIATNTLGEMFAEPNTNLAQTYPLVWKSWLGRRVDKLPAVRVAWLNWCGQLYKNHSELATDVDAAYKEKLIDPDEKVRIRALEILEKLDSAALANVSKGVFEAAATRLRDRKGTVREVAVDTLARIFSVKYLEVANGNGEVNASDKYSWIPGQILEVLYMDDIEARISVERALHDHIFPIVPEDSVRTERILNIMSFWSEKQRKAFVSVLDRQAKTIQTMGLFLLQCERFNGGIMDTDEEETSGYLQQIIAHIAGRFSDPKKAAGHLQKFAKTNDQRIYKLLRAVMDPQSDYKSIVKNMKEIIKRMDPQIMDTFSPLLRRVCLTLVPKDSIPILIEKIQAGRLSKDDHALRLSQTAEQLLKDISSVFPALYKSNLDRFMGMLKSEDNELVADSLEALARFAKTFPKEAPQDEELKERLVQFALEGTAKQAEYAVVVLAHIGEPYQSCERIIEPVMQNLNLSNERLVTHLSTLAQLARYMPDIFDDHNTTVTNFIVKDILLVNRRKAKADEPDWVEFKDLEVEGRIKVLGVRVLVQRLVALADKNGPEVATPVLKLLRRLLEFDGELVAEKDTPPSFQTHLRLVAATSMIELARYPSYSRIIGVTDMYKLALAIQDPIYQVRNAFVETLLYALSDKAIPFNYTVISFLAAHEPELELKTKVKHFLMRVARQQRADDTVQASLLEHLFVRFLHLLAHHPDFTTDKDDLQMFTAYIDFYLDAVGTSENASMLYYVSSKLKTFADLHAKSSENLYVLSDLAQVLIQERAADKGWSLPSYPGNVHLPKELVGKLPSDLGLENARKSYLPEDFLEGRLKAQNIHPKTKAVKKEKVISETKSTRRRSRSVTPGSDASESDTDSVGTTKRKRKARAAAAVKRRKGVDPIETTPLRKNAPRSAKKAASFRELSDDEVDDLMELDDAVISVASKLV